jgi:hypothetical protein
MQSKVQRADQDATAAKIGGVPSLAVDGRYLINNEAASSYEDSVAHHGCSHRQDAPGTQGQVRLAFAIQSLLSARGLIGATGLTAFGLVAGGVVLAQTMNLAACPLCILQRMLYLLLALESALAAGRLPVQQSQRDWRRC